MGYNNSIIYKIYCLDNNVKDFYIGSTINLQPRINRHKSYYDNGRKIKLYDFIRNNGSWDNWTYEIIKHYKCNNRDELRIEEQKIINAMKSTLNDVKAYRTIEEAKEMRKELFCLKREDILKYNKTKIICICGREINRNEKAPHSKTKIHLKLIENKNKDMGSSSFQENIYVKK